MIDLTNPKSLPRSGPSHIFVDERTGAQLVMENRLDDPMDAFGSGITNHITESDFNSMSDDYKKSLHSAMMNKLLGTLGDVNGFNSPLIEDPIPAVDGILRFGPYVTWNISLKEKVGLEMVELLEGLADDMSRHETVSEELTRKIAFFRSEWERFHAHHNEQRAKVNSESGDPIEQMLSELFGGKAKVIDLGSFKL